MVRVAEMDGYGAHVLRNTKGGDLETTLNISYTPSIKSISQLIKSTVELLEREGNEKGKEFKVPHCTWVMLKLSPSHDNRKTSKRHTG